MIKVVAEVDKKHPETQFNDGKCDDKGTLWIGALNKTFKPNSGSLYSVGKEMKFKK